MSLWSTLRRRIAPWQANENPAVMTRPDPMSAETIARSAPDAPLETPSPVNVGTPPIMTRTTKGGRPTEVIASGDPLENDIALEQALERYKAPVSKKQLALQGLFGFLQGGIRGAIANTAQYGLDQNYRNAVETGPELSRLEPRIKTEMLQRREENTLANDASMRDYRGAEATGILTRAGQKPNVQTGKGLLPDGSGQYAQMERDPSTNQWKMSTGPDGKPIIVDQPKEKTDKPKVKVNVPGVGEIEVTPGEALGYYGQVQGREAAAEDRTFTREEKSGEVSATNTALEQNIKEAGAERDKIWESLKDVPKTITVPGVTYSDGTTDPPKQVPNPAYTDLMTRGRKLDDDIKDWRVKIKPPGNPARGVRGGGRNYVAPKVSSDRLLQLMR